MQSVEKMMWMSAGFFVGAGAFGIDGMAAATVLAAPTNTLATGKVVASPDDPCARAFPAALARSWVAPRREWSTAGLAGAGTLAVCSSRPEYQQYTRKPSHARMTTNVNVSTAEHRDDLSSPLPPTPPDRPFRRATENR